MPTTIHDHVAHGMAAANAHLAALGRSTDHFDHYELADVVTDLLHLARALGFDTDLLLERARMHFDSEQAEEGTG